MCKFFVKKVQNICLFQKKAVTLRAKSRKRMEETFKTRQLTEYRTLSDGRSGCLVFVEPGTISFGKMVILAPALYLLDAPWREKDKAPFLEGLHEKEIESLKSDQELLSGFPAWLTAIALENPSKRDFPSFEDYRRILPKAFGWNQQSEALKFERTKKIKGLLEEIIGKDRWWLIEYTWMDNIVKYESNQYKNENLLTNGEFDYVKALWDNSWDQKFPRCHIKVDYDRWVKFLMGYGFPSVGLVNDPNQYMFENEDEWKEKGMTDAEMEKACDDLYEEEESQYQAYGFITALMNLARNLSVYKYSPSSKFYKKSTHDFYNALAPDLRVEKLDFDFDVATMTLCETYLKKIEEYSKFEEEKKPEVLIADMNQIDINILRDERMYERWFYDESCYPELLTNDQLEKIKGYCTTFQKFLTNKIGYDPGEEVMEKTEEKEHPAELCEYIDKEGVAKVGVKTAEEVEKELRQASSRKAPEFAKLLHSYEKLGYLDFKGHGKKTIYENLKKHYGNMNYTYKNFVAYF